MKKKPTKKPKKKLSMAKRVDRVMLKAAQAGNLRQVGDHWHFGGITKETFVEETVMPGEKPILLPCQESPTTCLSLEDVRHVIQRVLEDEDAS